MTVLDQLLAFYISNSTSIWLIAGFVLIACELTLSPGVGLLFAGLGALSLGALLAFDLLLATRIEWHFILFCAFTLGWTLLLWKPFKRYLNSTKNYDIYSGTTAIVQEPLNKQATSSVRWSGAQMRARIRPEANLDTIETGEQVFIHSMRDGVLLVDIQPPEDNLIGD